MACGLAVIGSRVIGIREIVEHGVNGLLCRPEEGDLREKIEVLMGDEKLRESLGRAARETAEERFALDRIAGLELELLQSVAGFGRGAGPA